MQFILFSKTFSFSSKENELCTLTFLRLEQCGFIQHQLCGNNWQRYHGCLEKAARLGLERRLDHFRFHETRIFMLMGESRS